MRSVGFVVRGLQALALFFALTMSREALADESPASVWLYTIGAGGEMVSHFGHSFLCTRDAGNDTPEGGHCYDYGVPERDDVGAIVWSAVRNHPGFTPVKIDERMVLSFFESQGRQVERQRIDLALAERARLFDLLEGDVRDKRAYAYHPYWANCSTKLRDHLDTASGGRLRQGVTKLPPGTLREYMETGHSGSLGVLAAMALFLGEASEHVPTPWEAMLLPSALRDGVTEAFHAAPEQLDERIAVVLPTSRAIGRVALFMLAVALLVAARVSAHRGHARFGRAVVGGVLGVLAASVELAALLVSWPEVQRNWALAVLLPTDLLLPYLDGSKLALYAKVRLAMAVAFFALEIAGVVQQPMLPLAMLVALPMIGILSTTKERALSPTSSPRALPTGQ